MISVFGNARLFLYHLPTDMRKSFEGLGLLIEQAFPNELMTGSFFIFLNKRRDHMKVLYWDNDGFAIWYKRLEKGTFCKTALPASMSRREFVMLLEGITPKRLNRRYKHF